MFDRKIRPTAGWYSGSNIPMYLWECNQVFDYGDVPEDEEEAQEYIDMAEPVSIYIGDWTDDFENDPNGHDGFRAIYDPNMGDLAVVWSETVKIGNLGSPCIPGQVAASLGDPVLQDGQEAKEAVAGMRPYRSNYGDGGYAYYALPQDLYDPEYDKDIM